MITNFFDTESDTFTYQIFSVPNAKPSKKWKSFETELHTLLQTKDKINADDGVGDATAPPPVQCLTHKACQCKWSSSSS